MLQNVRYWLEEYHLDGLRLDATHAIVDTTRRATCWPRSRRSCTACRAAAPSSIAEDHRNLVQQIRPAEAGGLGLDGVWADDFHHALRTYLTGEREAYYANYTGRLADIAATIEAGLPVPGPDAPATGELRGTKVTDEPARAFVYCSENHDQVGNRALGERLAHLIDRERYLVASAVLLLVPRRSCCSRARSSPRRSPFQFFTDHNQELGKLVTEGRRKEFAGFAAFADPVRRERDPGPAGRIDVRSDPCWTGASCERNADVYDLYRHAAARCGATTRCYVTRIGHRLVPAR